MDSLFGGGSATSICWLEREDQVALALKTAVVVLEVTTGRTLRTFGLEMCLAAMEMRVSKIVHSASRRLFAIQLTSGAWNTIAVINSQDNSVLVIDFNTGQWTPILRTPTRISCFNFLDTEGKVVCGMEAGGLRFFDTPESEPCVNQDCLEYLGVIRSVDLLRSGCLVVNSGGSIQLLATRSPRQFNAGLLSRITGICPLDNGRAICASFRDSEDADLVDMETMETLTEHRVGCNNLAPSYTPCFPCASVDRGIAFLCSPLGDEFAFHLKIIGDPLSKWVKHLCNPPLLGAVSPDGEKLVTVAQLGGLLGDRDWELCVRRVLDGEVLASVNRAGALPSNIGFTSKTELYTEGHYIRASSLDKDEGEDGGGDGGEDEGEGECGYLGYENVGVYGFGDEDEDEDKDKDENEDQDDYLERHIQTDLTSPATFEHPLHRHVRKPTIRRSSTMSTLRANSGGQLRTEDRYGDRHIRTTFDLVSTSDGYRIRELREESIPPTPQLYKLDTGLEWVIDSKSRRVCWLPPGYVSGTEGGHFFTGTSIVMVGQDGVVRKLTFREPCSV